MRQRRSNVSSATIFQLECPQKHEKPACEEVNLHHLTLNIPQRDCCAGARCSGDAKMKYRAAPFLNVGSKAKRVFEIRMKAEFVDGRCLL